MILIQNKTKITQKDITKFMQQVGFKNLWLVLIAVAITALLGFTINNGTLVYTNYLFLVFAGGIAVFYFTFLFVTISKQSKKFKQIENEYSFGDEEIVVIGTAAGVSEKFNVRYEKLFKVKETKSYYFLFVNDYSALILNKNIKCFSRGDALKLHELLSMKLSAKQNFLTKRNLTK